MRLLAVTAAMFLLAPPIAIYGQRGGRGAAPPTSAREAAAIDLTGYWVSVITEDWKLRMGTPKKGAYDALTLTAEGRRVGDTWDPARDEAAGEQCRAYGAAGIMRLPGRLHITWQDANTLRIDTDAGTQTRLFHFSTRAAASAPSWQGESSAIWERANGPDGGGSLRVVTSNVRAGYLRKNGVPYGERATVTEHFDVAPLPDGGRLLLVTTIV